MSRWASSLALLVFAQLACAELPARLEISYDVVRADARIAEITALLERHGDAYRITESWHGKGIFALLGRAKRTSEGNLTPQGPRPKEFTDERSGRDTARAWFDWAANSLTLRYKGKTRTEPMPPNAQDRLSFILAFLHAPPGTKSMPLALVDGKGVSYHVYQLGGRERVQTGAGDFDALKITRDKDGERTEIWLADSLGGLPVRMLVVEKSGTRWDQIATRIAR